MFSLLTAYIKNIVVLLLFSMFAQMLLPDSKFRGYIKIVTGVVLIAVILKPLGNIVDNGRFNLFQILEEDSKITSSYLLDESPSNEILMKIYTQNVEEKMGEILAQKGIKTTALKVNTVADENSDEYLKVQSVQVHIENPETVTVFGDTNNAQINQQVKEIIVDSLNIDSSFIEILYD